MIRKLKPYLKGYGKYALLCCLCMIGEAVLELCMPFLMAKIVDVGIPNNDLDYVIQMGMLMIGIAVISLCCGAGASWLSAKASMGVGSQLRKGVFDKIQQFSFANIDHFSTASLVTRTTTDISNIQNMFMMLNKMALRSPVMLVFAIFMASMINSQLVTVFLCVVPVLAIALFMIVKMAFPRFEAMLAKYDALNHSIQENLISIRVVKAFVRAKHEKEKFSESNDGLMKASIAAEKIVIFNMPIMQLATYFCIIAILWFGGNLVIEGSMLTGELMSFITYITQILMALMMLSMIFVNVLISSASITRVIEVLDETVDILDGPHPEYQLEDGSIVFKNVGFGYKKDTDDRVLKNIDLTIQSGEMIGIIGGTGSSKTSLVQLIARLYDVNEGEIIVGGHNVKDYDLKTLRDGVSMVLQKNVLFSGSIEENLRWGDAKASFEEIEEACRQACADEFIQDLPGQYQMDLGQGGVNVSGGQKQRLTIARALLKKPKIIILDDSTSAVDTATDAKIRQAFKENLSETTTLIIAQRISSIESADRIVVMDNGMINAVGTHEELLANNPIYQEVYYSQNKGGIEQ